ncbi:MAG: hypothetical protein TREMPRED_005937 [Tremellales sp. Tagirdzhanova-0007]|nr:MAG: hypothetical protein TREMPRED_005937 [Tremellales sp. Tagirdzhanova-0007]
MRTLHLDLDPGTPTYQQAPLSKDDDHDELISLGSWRLPRSRHAAGVMLWRLWDMPELDLDSKEIDEKLGDTQEHVSRRCTDLLRARKTFATITRLSEKKMVADAKMRTEDQEVPKAEIEHAHLVSSTWVYLRSKHLVNRTLLMILDCELSLLTLFDTPAPEILPSWTIAERKQQNSLQTMQTGIESATSMMVFGNHDAAWTYLMAMVELAPWYPTELYMPEWEARLSGLSTIWITLHHKLARAALRLNLPAVALAVCEAISFHPFSYNDENAITSNLWCDAAELYNDTPSCKTRGRLVDEEAFLYRQTWQIAILRRLLTLSPENLTRQSEVEDFELRDVVRAAIGVGDCHPDKNADVETMWYRATNPRAKVPRP